MANRDTGPAALMAAVALALVVVLGLTTSYALHSARARSDAAQRVHNVAQVFLQDAERAISGVDLAHREQAIQLGEVARAAVADGEFLAPARILALRQGSEAMLLYTAIGASRERMVGDANEIPPYKMSYLLDIQVLKGWQVSHVTWQFDHPTIKTRDMRTFDAAGGYKVSYPGWRCLEHAKVIVQTKDRGQISADFDACLVADKAGAREAVTEGLAFVATPVLPMEEPVESPAPERSPDGSDVAAP